MTDRIDSLITQIAAAEAAKAEEIARQQMKVRQEEAEAARVQRLLGEKLQLVDAAVNEANAKLQKIGLSLVAKTDRDQGTDLAEIVVKVSDSPGMLRGSIRFHRSGKVHFRVTSENHSSWSMRQSTIDGLDGAEVTDFIADILEARLRPLAAKTDR